MNDVQLLVIALLVVFLANLVLLGLLLHRRRLSSEREEEIARMAAERTVQEVDRRMQRSPARNGA